MKYLFFSIEKGSTEIYRSIHHRVNYLIESYACHVLRPRTPTSFKEERKKVKHTLGRMLKREKVNALINPSTYVSLGVALSARTGFHFRFPRDGGAHQSVRIPRGTRPTMQFETEIRLSAVHYQTLSMRSGIVADICTLGTISARGASGSLSALNVSLRIKHSAYLKQK